MKRKIAATVLLLVLLVGICSVASQIISEKFINDSTTIIDGFYAEEDNDIDVLLVGSSNCFCTIDPVVLYEEYGIAAYDFASSSQPLSMSLYYLQEAFKTQSPKIVALEANMIPEQSLTAIGENALRWGLTDMPFTWNKICFLYQTLGKADGEFISYVFPILRYHERWKEVYKTDFTYPYSDKTNYSKGYLETQETASEGIDLSGYIAEGSTWIQEEVEICLNEIYSLCKENGAQLVLFKSPRMYWYSYHTAAVRELADAREIPYIDYNEMTEEIGLDVTTDFRDGEHLNDSGAAKVSRNFGAWLTRNYTLPDRRDDAEPNSWDEALSYRNREQTHDFTQAAAVNECMELLAQDDSYVALVTYKGDESGDILPHQWIYIGGEAVLHREWADTGVAHYHVKGAELVLVRRAGFCQTLVENIDYYDMSKDWSVVVYDTLIEEVTASLSFDA